MPHPYEKVQQELKELMFPDQPTPDANQKKYLDAIVNYGAAQAKFLAIQRRLAFIKKLHNREVLAFNLRAEQVTLQRVDTTSKIILKRQQELASLYDQEMKNATEASKLLELATQRVDTVFESLFQLKSAQEKPVALDVFETLKDYSVQAHVVASADEPLEQSTYHSLFDRDSTSISHETTTIQLDGCPRAQTLRMWMSQEQANKNTAQTNMARQQARLASLENWPENAGLSSRASLKEIQDDQNKQLAKIEIAERNIQIIKQGLQNTVTHPEAYATTPVIADLKKIAELSQHSENTKLELHRLRVREEIALKQSGQMPEIMLEAPVVSKPFTVDMSRSRTSEENRQVEINQLAEQLNTLNLACFDKQLSFQLESNKENSQRWLTAEHDRRLAQAKYELALAEYHANYPTPFPEEMQAIVTQLMPVWISKHEMATRNLDDYKEQLASQKETLKQRKKEIKGINLLDETYRSIQRRISELESKMKEAKETQKESEKQMRHYLFEVDHFNTQIQRQGEPAIDLADVMRAVDLATRPLLDKDEIARQATIQSLRAQTWQQSSDEFLKSLPEVEIIDEPRVQTPREAVGQPFVSDDMMTTEDDVDALINALPSTPRMLVEHEPQQTDVQPPVSVPQQREQNIGRKANASPSDDEIKIPEAIQKEILQMAIVALEYQTAKRQLEEADTHITVIQRFLDIREKQLKKQGKKYYEDDAFKALRKEMLDYETQKAEATAEIKTITKKLDAVRVSVEKANKKLIKNGNEPIPSKTIEDAVKQTLAQGRYTEYDHVRPPQHFNFDLLKPLLEGIQGKSRTLAELQVNQVELTELYERIKTADNQDAATQEYKTAQKAYLEQFRTTLTEQVIERTDALKEMITELRKLQVVMNENQLPREDEPLSAEAKKKYRKCITLANDIRLMHDLEVLISSIEAARNLSLTQDRFNDFKDAYQQTRRIVSEYLVTKQEYEEALAEENRLADEMNAFNTTVVRAKEVHRQVQIIFSQLPAAGHDFDAYKANFERLTMAGATELRTIPQYHFMQVADQPDYTADHDEEELTVSRASFVSSAYSEDSSDEKAFESMAAQERSRIASWAQQYTEECHQALGEYERINDKLKAQYHAGTKAFITVTAQVKRLQALLAQMTDTPTTEDQDFVTRLTSKIEQSQVVFDGTKMYSNHQNSYSRPFLEAAPAVRQANLELLEQFSEECRALIAEHDRKLSTALGAQQAALHALSTTTTSFQPPQPPEAEIQQEKTQLEHDFQDIRMKMNHRLKNDLAIIQEGSQQALRRSIKILLDNFKLFETIVIQQKPEVLEDQLAHIVQQYTHIEQQIITTKINQFSQEMDRKPQASPKSSQEREILRNIERLLSQSLNDTEALQRIEKQLDAYYKAPSALPPDASGMTPPPSQRAM